MYFIFYSIFAPLKQNKYERKEKKQSNSPLRVIII